MKKSYAEMGYSTFRQPPDRAVRLNGMIYTDPFRHINALYHALDDILPTDINYEDRQDIGTELVDRGIIQLGYATEQGKWITYEDCYG